MTTALAGDLVAEINKTQARTVRLALPAGRYLLRKPEGAFVRVGEAVVMPNTLATVRDQDMAQVPYTEVARRGPGLPQLWQVELGLQLSSGAIQGAGLTPALAAMLMREFGALELAFGVSTGYASFDGQALSLSQYEGWALGESRWRARLGLFLPYIGIGVAAVSFTKHSHAIRNKRSQTRSTCVPWPTATGWRSDSPARLGSSCR